jgi:hypothetical protein
MSVDVVKEHRLGDKSLEAIVRTDDRLEWR